MPTISLLITEHAQQAICNACILAGMRHCNDGDGMMFDLSYIFMNELEPTGGYYMLMEPAVLQLQQRVQAHIYICHEQSAGCPLHARSLQSGSRIRVRAEYQTCSHGSLLCYLFQAIYIRSGLHSIMQMCTGDPLSKAHGQCHSASA